MSRKQLLFAFLFLDFALLTGWSLYHVGYLGIFEVAIQNPGGTQVFVDLAIAVAISLGFIWQDAKKLGINAIPYFIAAPFFGSLALLIYLVHREGAKRRSALPAGQRSAA